MTRKTTQSAYDSVFESGRSRKRAKSGIVPEPAASSPDDVVEFVESQIRQITNAVRLMAGTPEEISARPIDPLQCEQCRTSDEPHLHRAKLFAAGKELY